MCGEASSSSRRTGGGGERLEAAAASGAGDCRIKGNISRKGTRIYHVPGGHSYAKTRIDEANRERLFCSEAETRAGWRRAWREGSAFTVPRDCLVRRALSLLVTTDGVARYTSRCVSTLGAPGAVVRPSSPVWAFWLEVLFKSPRYEINAATTLTVKCASFDVIAAPSFA